MDITTVLLSFAAASYTFLVAIVIIHHILYTEITSVKILFQVFFEAIFFPVFLLIWISDEVVDD